MLTESIIIGLVTLGLLITFLVEGVLTFTWHKRYFLHGLIIFSIHIPVQLKQIPIPSSSVFEEKLNSQWFGSLLFKEISFNSYAFCKSPNKVSMHRFMDFMHGLLIFDSSNEQIIVKGFMNWIAIYLSVIWLAMLSAIILSEPDFAGIFILVLFYFVLFAQGYLVQSHQFRQVAKVAVELCSTTFEQNKERA